MKNKIIVTSLASILLIVGFIGTTSANFGNFTQEDMESYRTVMNKLMDGTTLTSDEQVLLDEIKTRRAENSVYREERQAQREKLAPIIEKRRAGEELTDIEQTTIDTFRAERQTNGNKMGGKRGGGRMGGRNKGGNRIGGNRGFNGECPYGK